MENEPKFCVNCKWCHLPKARRGDGIDYACHHPINTNLVTGKPDDILCLWARGLMKSDSERTPPCGKEGKLYEAK